MGVVNSKFKFQYQDFIGKITKHSTTVAVQNQGGNPRDE